MLTEQGERTVRAGRQKVLHLEERRLSALSGEDGVRLRAALEALLRDTEGRRGKS